MYKHLAGGLNSTSSEVNLISLGRALTILLNSFTLGNQKRYMILGNVLDLYQLIYDVEITDAITHGNPRV